MKLIDSHCHLDLSIFDQDREQVLNRCADLGIDKIIVPGIQAEGWQALLTLCEQQPMLMPAIGLHPLFIARHTDNDLQQLQQNIEQNKPVAVGEIGLDFYDKTKDRKRQQYFFEQQLQIAQTTALPVILHVRKAHDQTLLALKNTPQLGGIVHAFNGSVQQAHKYIDLNFKLGFGGMLTYPRSTKLRTLASTLPLSSLVLETDAPDMTVAAHRGERNSPEYLLDCLQTLAEIREEDIDTIAEQTCRNVEQVLGLTPSRLTSFAQ